MSLRLKIILLVSLILIITTLSLLFFTFKDVGSALTVAERSSNHNILHMLMVNVKEMNSLRLSAKYESIKRRRGQLKALTHSAVSILDQYLPISENGNPVPVTMLKNAQNLVTEFAISGISLAVMDRDGNIIAHKNPDIQGTSISKAYDLKGRNMAELMRDDKIQVDGEFITFKWHGGYLETQDVLTNKLVFCLPYSRFKWSICAIIDIDDIEEENQKNLKNIIRVLKESFKKLELSKRGSAFILGDKGDYIIPPQLNIIGDFSKIINTRSGIALKDELIASARGTNQTVVVEMETSVGFFEEFEVQVRHFKTLDWYLGIAVPVREVRRPASKVVAHQSYIITLIFLCSLATVAVVVTQIAHPLDTLASYAKNIPLNNFMEENDGDDTVIKLRDTHNDEVGRLAGALAHMKTELHSKIGDLMIATASRERIESELKVAREIQMGILPKIFPPFPGMPEIDLAAILKPAKEVGGDLYDFFIMGERKICFAVGDVADKGVPAALFMVIARTLIKTSAKQGLSPAKIMTEVNRELSADNPRSMFLTLILGIIDLDTGIITYANGGHNPPILADNKGEVSFLKERSGPIVGAVNGIVYRELSLQLNPGSTLLLYTDGVTEAMSIDNEVYSNNRLLNDVKHLQGQPLNDMIDQIMKNVDSHTGNFSQSDDIAMLALKFKL